MDKTKKKVFIVSLDGATFDILKPFVDMGIMPNIKQLMSSGSYSELDSTIPPITPVAWTSFMTGKNPEKHGVFGFLRYMPQTRETDFVSSATIKGKTIWQILSEKGKKVVVIHLPMTYPPYEVNGYMVSGFETPSVKSDFTYPKNFKQEILKLIPDYSFHQATGDDYFYDKEFDEYIEKVKGSLEQRFLIADYMVDKKDWDVFMLQFQDLDHLQHKLWHYIEPNNNVLNQQRREKVYECYSFMDSMVGKLHDKIKNIPHYKMIVSDHGFGPSHITIHPNSLFKEWNYLHLKSNEELNIINKIKKIITFIQNSIKEFKHTSVNIQLNGRLISYSRHKVDWSKTKVYVPMADYGGALCYINKKGREPNGIVTDKEYKILCNEIKDRCTNLVEPLSGEKVFSEVLIGYDYYNKDIDTSLLPDLMLIPNDKFGVSSKYLINGIFSQSVVPGTHRINGIFIANGDNIKKGFSGFKARIIDIVPTILYLLGLSIPSDMDGSPLLDIVNQEKRNVKWEDTRDDSTGGLGKSSRYTKKEEEILEENLKNLGYM